MANIHNKTFAHVQVSRLLNIKICKAIHNLAIRILI